jgi:hypothetical protein
MSALDITNLFSMNWKLTRIGKMFEEAESLTFMAASYLAEVYACRSLAHEVRQILSDQRLQTTRYNYTLG